MNEIYNLEIVANDGRVILSIVNGKIVDGIEAPEISEEMRQFLAGKEPYIITVGGER